MSRTHGTIHRTARADSGPARLWQWARSRRAPWTCAEAAEACAISPQRCRSIVATLHGADVLTCVAEMTFTGGGRTSARWTLSAVGRALTAAPVLIVDPATKAIAGVRIAAADGAGTARLRSAVERSGLSTQEAASRLRVNDRTLRRLLAGDPPLAVDDPLVERAREL